MMIRDMTSGSTMRHLIQFSIPLILGNIFQLTYNAVDSIIVGKYIGTEALAAVGTVNPVMNLIILGISGICIGASVLMSSYFGAKQMGHLKRALATTMFLGLIFSVLIVTLGFLCSGYILRFLRVPDEILPLSLQYLYIILWGIPFTFVYNAYASAMRSVGDSRTPLVFLAAVSVLNGILDYLLIAKLRLGVEGAAAATVFSQALSGVLCFWYARRRMDILNLKWPDMKIDKKMMKQTLQHGSITALQQSCQPIGKLLIQSSVNGLGINAIAAFNAVTRIDDFALTPEQSISHGMMTFTAQNRGAGETKRMKKGLSQGLLLEVCYWVGICIVIIMLRKPLMQLFLQDNTEAVSMGVEYISLMAFFYLIPAFTNGIQGYCRGLGNMGITLAATLLQISIRTAVVMIFAARSGLAVVVYASALGWACMLAVQIIYLIYHKKKWRA